MQEHATTVSKNLALILFKQVQHQLNLWKKIDCDEAA